MGDEEPMDYGKEASGIFILLIIIGLPIIIGLYIDRGNTCVSQDECYSNAQMKLDKESDYQDYLDGQQDPDYQGYYDNSNRCLIKGNISYNTQEKIYHVPGCTSYSATVINADYGERWFCSEQEAINAGWRKAYNCP